MKYGHRSDDGRLQTNLDHLTGTRALCEQFAQAFGAEATARQMAMAHDIGKYSQAFQDHLLHDGPRVDHSTAGAKELFRLGMFPAALCVAGRHGGLPDLGSRNDVPEALLL